MKLIVSSYVNEIGNVMGESSPITIMFPNAKSTGTHSILLITETCELTKRLYLLLGHLVRRPKETKRLAFHVKVMLR